MANYIRYNDKMAFHPGAYIDDFIKSYGLTQKDFSARLGTTPKNLCTLIQGEQRLSQDMAQKLACVTNISTQTWQNLQNSYDKALLIVKEQEQKEREKKVISDINYSSLSSLYSLPDLKRKTDEQIPETKHSLGISDLEELKRVPSSTCLRHSKDMTEANIVRSNVMILFATNAAIKTETAPFNRQKLDRAVESALTKTTDYEGMYEAMQEEFRKAGVVFFVLPNIPGSKLNGAVKKLRRKVVLLVSDRNRTVDTLFFTLLHEIAHIKNNDWGPYFEKDEGEAEERADRYAEDMLIPPEKYSAFFISRSYDRESILSFAREINRDPGIVVARLQKDGVVRYDDKELNSLKHVCSIKQDTSICLRPFDVDISEALK